MNIECMTAPPDRHQAVALAAFESEFRYPLGSTDSFSISHGDDYTRFFRSMGDAHIYLAKVGDEIVGSLVVVGRSVALANGNSIRAAYLCDVKVLKRLRGRTVLGRLALAARHYILSAGYQAAFSVVMSGSLPSDQVTGRLQIPPFTALGKLIILRLDTSQPIPHIPIVSCPSRNHLRAHGGDAALSSNLTPQWIIVPGARGRLLDTRRGKRLWTTDGTEMISAHLSEIEFETSESLTTLLRAASDTAARDGYPALFLAIPAGVLDLETSRVATTTVAEATVFGTGLPEGDWWVNTAEI
jgi:hypothetical protein